ncbi:hypothetical protein [Candidatus Carsonella ruddii]|uniref:Uncharacterized protein n=2 Tax=Carsonella ruddii TaxID=114186 RepID=A0AAE7G5D1_CARRU|nr:hypothetical protein [Candidatus Carsonella ruddii]AGS06538.1 hypothetical protein CRDC_00255 [Candidatus Carsonella ruddii DC]ALA96797.1 hypothetical protein AMC76_00265 [Candidatus Carsonella ruddii]QLK14019.1 hypothetical protein FK493_00255 [Candidatus Carsonella ruddii]
MKFKYKIKLFVRNNNNSKILKGTFINKNKYIQVYVPINVMYNKIFKNNFLIIKLIHKIYFVFIKFIKISYINNKIEYFIFENIKKEMQISYNCSGIKFQKKITFYNNKNIFPRSVNLFIVYKKKTIKENDFLFKNFRISNKKLFFFKI